MKRLHTWWSRNNIFHSTLLFGNNTKKKRRNEFTRRISSFEIQLFLNGIQFLSRKYCATILFLFAILLLMLYTTRAQLSKPLNVQIHNGRDTLKRTDYRTSSMPKSIFKARPASPSSHRPLLPQEISCSLSTCRLCPPVDLSTEMGCLNVTKGRARLTDEISFSKFPFARFRFFTIGITRGKSRDLMIGGIRPRAEKYRAARVLCVVPSGSRFMNTINSARR